MGAYILRRSLKACESSAPHRELGTRLLNFTWAVWFYLKGSLGTFVLEFHVNTTNETNGCL